jgi:hypothetical protein
MVECEEKLMGKDFAQIAFRFMNTIKEVLIMLISF